MAQQYRLLRNNKESGPFTAEQLIKLGLKAYDLIWIDGKSAAWRYPSEVPELEAYAPSVEEQPFDRFYHKPGGQDNTPVQSPAAKAPAENTGKAENKEQSAIPASNYTKPRIRIRADWRQVENTPTAAVQAPPPAETPVNIPAKSTEPATTEQKASPAGVGWEETMQSWKQEQTQNDRMKIKADADAAVPQVRYATSLDNLKKRYEETVLLAKKNFTEKQWMRYGFGFLLIPMLGLAVWLGKKKDNTPVTAGTARTETPVVNKEAPTVLSAADLKEEVPAPQPASGHKAAAGKKHIPPQQHTDKQHLPAGTNAIAAAKDSQARALALKKAGTKPAVITGTKKAGAKDSNTLAMAAAVKKETIPANAINNNNTATAVAGQAAPKTTVITIPQKQATEPPPYNPPPAASKKQISDYVAVKEDAPRGSEDRNMKLHVKNLSNLPVDLVVVDLQYYDNRGRFQKGETMYVNHLAPKDEVALQPPANRSGQKVTYRVSLLSIEKKGIYLIAD